MRPGRRNGSGWLTAKENRTVLGGTLFMTEEIYGEAMKFFSDRQQDPGKRTGLNVQFTETRKKYPTLSVEVAPILEPGQSPYWASKITIQLTPTELTAFCGVMF